MKTKSLLLFFLIAVLCFSSCNSYNVKPTDNGISYNKQNYCEIGLWQYNLVYDTDNVKVVGKIKPFISCLGSSQNVSTSKSDAQENILFIGTTYYVKKDFTLPDFRTMQLSDLTLSEPLSLDNVLHDDYETENIEIENFGDFQVPDLLNAQITLEKPTKLYTIYATSTDYKYLSVCFGLFSDGNQLYIGLYDEPGYLMTFYTLSESFTSTIQQYI